MKIAIVHDWLYRGGAEKVVEQLHILYPDAPIYTSYCTDEWRRRLDGKVVTGYLNRWPFASLRKFLPLLRQWWFSGLDLSEFDVIISSSGNGEARFVRARKGAVHISYTHTPTHFYYRKYDEYMQNPGFRPYWLVRIGLRLLVGYLRRQDYKAASRVDELIANSSHIQADIKKYYDRESTVIHPPIATSRFVQKKATNKKTELRFVTWGRLVPYKRFDIAVEACARLGYHLDVIGDGPDRARLEKLAGDTVHFHGAASDEDLERLANEASAFIFPSDEDFGISPVEAMAAGLPVIAYRSGGALDYVQEGLSGCFFDEQSVDSLSDALKRFDPIEYDATKITSYAVEKFDEAVFRKNISAFIAKHSRTTK